MFYIGCENCGELNQIHDRFKNKTVKCHICNEVIQNKKNVSDSEKIEDIKDTFKETFKDFWSFKSNKQKEIKDMSFKQRFNSFYFGKNIQSDETNKKIIGKKCNQCLEVINKDAKKCKFCGHSFVPDFGFCGNLLYLLLILTIPCAIINIFMWNEPGKSFIGLILSSFILYIIIKITSPKYVYEDDENNQDS